ncbi:PIN-like domain-containing protein [Methylobacterium oryzihabitans]|uniref:PIN like domain-containing protein n=1 Tax=Methylobacterium oryzihabitans TaxID=2499852 RepID=A0A437P877_9HYPH|nr:PIN-like domain-containing protein [Methylobacterium oryzihabitans]RVU18486.1 hypothetical protein EOE48_11435 [Methylobacterium oryzihabitans]
MALAHLIHAVHPQPNGVTLQETAIALDANVFLRLSLHPQSADIVDYLGSAHPAPLILPGQAIQEFWNNQLQAVDSVASSIKKTFQQLQSQVSKLDPSFGEFQRRFEELLDDFSGDFAYTYDEGTVRKTQSFLGMLQRTAMVPYVTRLCFVELAAHRKQTRTPPGFQDTGDGDFYIWADFLLGLQQARSAGRIFSRAVLVTEDSKKDWSRKGVAHPILCSEVNAVAGVPFEVWSLKNLADVIASAA